MHRRFWMFRRGSNSDFNVVCSYVDSCIHTCHTFIVLPLWDPVGVAFVDSHMGILLEEIELFKNGVLFFLHGGSMAHSQQMEYRVNIQMCHVVFRCSAERVCLSFCFWNVEYYFSFCKSKRKRENIGSIFFLPIYDIETSRTSVSRKNNGEGVWVWQEEA